MTGIEMVIVVGILAVLLVAVYPAIVNTLETRGLENSAREILTTLQSAKFHAVKSKYNHRVRFVQAGGKWSYVIEEEYASGQWRVLPGFVPKTINPKFTVVINLPDTQTVIYSPLGVIDNYDASRNTIILSSMKIRGYNQLDRRVLTVYAGGSIRYEKSRSG